MSRRRRRDREQRQRDDSPRKLFPAGKKGRELYIGLTGKSDTAPCSIGDVRRGWVDQEKKKRKTRLNKMIQACYCRYVFVSCNHRWECVCIHGL